MGGNYRRKELVMWWIVANVPSTNTHNINKLLENNSSDARNCAIVDTGKIQLQILFIMKEFA